MDNLDNLLSEFFGRKNFGTKKEVLNYFKLKGVEASSIIISEYLDKNCAYSKVHIGIKHFVRYYYLKENNRAVESLVKEKEAENEKIKSIIFNYLDTNIAATFNEISSYVQKEVGLKIKEGHLKGYGYLFSLKGKGKKPKYYFRKEERENARVIVKDKKRERNAAKLLVDEYLSSHLMGTYKEINEYVKSKNSSNYSLFGYLKKFDCIIFDAGTSKPCRYFFIKENKEEAEDFLNASKKNMKFSIESYFESNIIGTRNEIISFFSEKGVNATRTAVFNRLKDYGRKSVAKGRGHSATYFFDMKRKEEAEKMLEELEKKDNPVISLLESFFEKNITGTHNDIINFIKNEGVNIPSSTVNGYLVNYITMRVPNGKGRPLTYYFLENSKRKAAKIIKERHGIIA